MQYSRVQFSTVQGGAAEEEAKEEEASLTFLSDLDFSAMQVRGENPI